MEILRLLSINCFCRSNALKMWWASLRRNCSKSIFITSWNVIVISNVVHFLFFFPVFLSACHSSSPSLLTHCMVHLFVVLPLIFSVSPFLLPHTVTPLALHVLLPGTPHNQDHSGTLGPEEFKACLISLGYDIGNDAQVLNASGEHSQMLNCEKITLFSFLFLFVLIHLSLLFLCLTIYTSLFYTTSSLNVLCYLFLLDSLIVCLGRIPFMSSNYSI